MAKIEVINIKYVIIRYDDGFIVSFIKTNDSLMVTADEVSYADQIHRIVSNNIQNILFASDVVDQISCPDGLKEKISKNLIVYSNKGLCISGCNIHQVYSKNKVEIINKDDVVLTIKRQKTLGLGKLLLYIIVATIAYQIIFPDDPFKHVKHEDPVVKEQSDTTQLPDVKDVNDTVGDLDHVNNNVEAVDVTYVQNTGHALEPKQRQIEDANTSRTVTTAAETTSETEILAKEANEHLRIAEEAYNKYVINLEKEDGINALTHYNKALQLSDYLPDKKENIVEHIETLNKVFN